MPVTISRNESYAQIFDSMDSISENKKARQISPAGLLVYFYFIVILHYSLPHGARYLAFAMSRLGFIFRRGA